MQDFELEVYPSKTVPLEPQFRTLKHGEEYKIVCRNNLNVRCDVKLSVDGLQVGKWRIDGRSTIYIERPAGVERKFTFVKEGSGLAYSSGLQAHRDNGLIEAVFHPEKIIIVPKSFNSHHLVAQGLVAEGPAKRGPVAEGYSSGGTTLGAQSKQTFGTASALDSIDQEKITTLRLRLIVREEPAALVALRHYSEEQLRTQPVPPRLPGQY